MCYWLQFILLAIALPSALANSHRESPTALDSAAAMQDFYVFVGSGDPTKVTFILRADSAFDPTVVYAIHAGSSIFEFRFATTIGATGARQTYSVSTAQGPLGAGLRKDK